MSTADINLHQTTQISRCDPRVTESGLEVVFPTYGTGQNRSIETYRLGDRDNTTRFYHEAHFLTTSRTQPKGYLPTNFGYCSLSHPSNTNTLTIQLRGDSPLSSDYTVFRQRALQKNCHLVENHGSQTYRSNEQTYRLNPPFFDEANLQGIGTRECIKFRNRIFRKHPEFNHVLVKSYMRIAREKNYVEANRNLRALDARLSRRDLRLTMDDDQIKDFCKGKAIQCERIAAKFPSQVAAMKITQLLNHYGISFPVKGDQLLPAIRRCEDQVWWRRQVRKIQVREYEQICREMGLVHKRSEIYASNTNIRKRRLQKARNRKLLAELTATNQFDQEFTLEELSALSNSNPEIRRSELMVRMRGFETVAKNMGLVAEFYTITCPSRFHSMHTDGRKNETYRQYTTRQANDYLCKVWARIRAKLHRDEIKVFGFRIVEPHHDGCPHWHLILFMCADQAIKCRKITKHYALQDSPDEPGAMKHRFKAEPIDPNKGSATGYVAKYISKNLNGKGIDCDQYGNNAIEAAERIETWACLNGIRQFQQIGGPPVTVWRELRRLNNEQSGLVEAARKVADSADWAGFVDLMGGPYCGRDTTIHIARWQEIDEETGEVLDPVLNRYGEVAKHKIYGIWCKGVRVITRFYRWVIGLPKKRPESESAFKGVITPPWSTVNNCTDVS